jgi:hypothetical protein
VRTAGGLACRFSGMDAVSAAKLFQVFQKYIVLSEQHPSAYPQNAD